MVGAPRDATLGTLILGQTLIVRGLRPDRGDPSGDVVWYRNYFDQLGQRNETQWFELLDYAGRFVFNPELRLVDGTIVRDLNDACCSRAPWRRRTR